MAAAVAGDAARVDALREPRDAGTNARSCGRWARLCDTDRPVWARVSRLWRGRPAASIHCFCFHRLGGLPDA